MKPIALILLLILLVVPASAQWQWCGAQDIFFWNASSDISGYKIIDHIPELSVQKSITSPSFTSSSGEVIVGTWATPIGSPGVTSIGPGLFRFRTYAFASSSSGATTLKFYIINRSATGTETALFFGNAITRDIEATTVPTEYLTSYARRNYTTMFPGDRLVIRVNASTDSASARTVTMELAGNTNASMVSISYFLCNSVLSNGSVIYQGQPVNDLPVPLAIPLLALIGVIALWSIRKR